MIKFLYNGHKYEADWHNGYAYIEQIGAYLTADFSNGLPMNIRKINLFIKPIEFSVARLVDE
jgi:hypothetical protein